MYRSTWTNHRIRCIEGPEGMNRFRKFNCGFCSSSFLARDHLRFCILCLKEMYLYPTSDSMKEYTLVRSLGSVTSVEKDFSTETGGKLMLENAQGQNLYLASWKRLKTWLIKNMDSSNVLFVIKYSRRQIDLKNMHK